MKFGFLSVFALASAALAADVQIVDQVIARVNGDIISQDELGRTQREAMAEMKAQGISPEQIQREFEEHAKNNLRDRIDQLLLVQKAKDLNISVDPEVTRYMTDLQRQSGITDQDKFHEFVRQQSGMSYEDFLAEAKNNFVTRQVINEEVGRKINITPKEIQDYYDAHKKDFIREEKVYLSEILISTEGKDPAGVAAAEKKAKQISSDAAKGQRFSELARDNSDANTAKAGGVLGSYKKGDLAKQFEEAVWNLPKGGVTQPLRIPTGFEILKVDDHTKAGLEPVQEAKQEIENQLYGPKLQPEVRTFLTQLRKSAFLQIKPGYVDTGAAAGQNTTWQDPAVLKPETVTKAEVEQKTRHKRLLWVVPIPGTKETVTGNSSSR
ncbi:MAG TPA: peptidylprolyl isomerase [Bryobacteraceae bacterium]|jgi:parvulin-like peptidyl-prolyl isomerase|nr:peptidylprolyl isomerase [Bryobacteraceae bacterium]